MSLFMKIVEPWNRTKARNPILILLAASVTVANPVLAEAEFRPGEVWLDTNDQPIQAHGGGVLPHNSVFYWYGEDRTPGGDGAVACYSSTNLYRWKREGVALAKADLPSVDGRRTFVERPKVIYNARTKQFVMWMHLEQRGYRFAHAGVAVSPKPEGPFEFIKAVRPIANTNQFATQDPDPNNERQLGGTFRDMNLFMDDDGRAYVFYAAEDNLTLYVTRLDEHFTSPEAPVEEGKTWARILVRRHREAPAPFKWQGKYYLITSGCSGWKPNAADVAVASNILGPYRMLGNPCVGEGADLTFRSQSTFVLPIPGQSDRFIFMADRWNPENLPDSRYIWLPFTMQQNERFEIRWRDRWDLRESLDN
jgi:hypothetical protein